MKNETIAVIAAVLVVILGIQAYTMIRLNDRLNQLSGFYSQTGDARHLSEPDPFRSSNDDYLHGTPWNPYAEIQHMKNQMERMFGDSFSRFHIKTPMDNLTKSPDIDLQEKTDRYVVTVDTPGADQSSMDVRLEGQVLRISIKTGQAQDENGEYRYRERFVGQFQRALTLPGPVNAGKMTTDYHDGILTITIPKA
jgi:HSP20 family protein